MRRTTTAARHAETVHKAQAEPTSTIYQQIAVSEHQRQATRQILQESRRLSDMTRRLLTRPPRADQAENDS